MTEKRRQGGYYEAHDKFYVSVDCIVFGVSEGELKLLLTRRDFEPYRGEWSLIGGFVKKDENIDASARRVLHEITGLEGVYMQQTGTFGSVSRDDGDRVISIAYTSLLNITDMNITELQESDPRWVNVDSIPPLCLDHREMVAQALSEIRHKIWEGPIAIKLMPEYFTLTQLQRLYESLLGTTIDKRNFRRRIQESSYVEPTDKIDKSTSRRGARLYKAASC